MNVGKDVELKNMLLLLLHEIDPHFESRKYVADEFAELLVNFTEAWATDPENVGEIERTVEEWIRSIELVQPDMSIRSSRIQDEWEQF